MEIKELVCNLKRINKQLDDLNNNYTKGDYSNLFETAIRDGRSMERIESLSRDFEDLSISLYNLAQFIEKKYNPTRIH